MIKRNLKITVLFCNLYEDSNQKNICIRINSKKKSEITFETKLKKTFETKLKKTFKTKLKKTFETKKKNFQNRN